MKLDYGKILEYISAKDKHKLFLVLGIIGIILISVSDVNFNSEKTVDKDNLSLYEYKTRTEKEITELLQEIKGVGSVKVMIMLESGEENIYAQQEKSATDTSKTQNGEDINVKEQNTYENEFVLISEQNDNQPIIEKTMQPVVQGVAVVCSGADDITVVTAVTNTVSVVLNVSTNRIYVTKMR